MYLASSAAFVGWSLLLAVSSGLFSHRVVWTDSLGWPDGSLSIVPLVNTWAGSEFGCETEHAAWAACGQQKFPLGVWRLEG